MCGRFTFATAPEVVAELFELSDVPALKPRYNIAPTQEVATIVAERASGRHSLRIMRWGLVPGWVKDPSLGSRLINARAETLAEKPAFRSAFRRQRCLIPADGFYEWRKIGSTKQPYHIRLVNGKPFAFAGLWEHWEGAGGSAIESCTIVTTEPNALLSELYNRMPVILPRDEFDVWLDPKNENTSALALLLRPYPSPEMEAYPVRMIVNAPLRDGPECVERGNA